VRRLELEISVGQAQPREVLSVLANVDECGRATETPDREIVRREMHPLTPPENGWLEGAWKLEPWLAAVDPDSPPIVARTPPLYFGNYRFLAVASGGAGNETVGDELAVLVNSGPDMLTGFKLFDVDDDGRPEFRYRRPGQWR